MTIGAGSHGVSLSEGLERAQDNFIVVADTDQEAAVLFDPVPVLQVLMLSGEKRVRFSGEAWLQVTPIDHEGRVVVDATDLDGYLAVSREGEYDVQVRVPSEYAPVQPRRVEIVRGAVSQVVFKLSTTAGDTQE
jgi:hypothetical protein